MANVYVEARPKGRPEGSPIQDYVVEDHANHELGVFKTQKEAIDWAKVRGHAPLVARVRHQQPLLSALPDRVMRPAYLPARATRFAPGRATFFPSPSTLASHDAGDASSESTRRSES
jgi:hypothetical protein